MKTKVMFINPPAVRDQYISPESYFPLGLLYLATVLKENNIDVMIIDINNNFYMKDFNKSILLEHIKNNLYKCIKDYMPDIIGIGCTFSGTFGSLKIIAKEIKDKFVNIPIVIGGIHPTLFAREILRKYNYIDYVVIGEGEVTFLELVRCITNKHQSKDSIDGIAFRHKGDIKLNFKTKFVKDLDTLPFVNYNFVNVEEYKMDTSGWFSPKKLKLGQPFPIISSRSCPERCNFCSMWLVHGPTIRLRSSNNVLDEMEYLYNDYNVRLFHFMDDNLTFNKRRILEICKGVLKRNMNIQFDTPNGLAIKRLDQEIIDAMVDAGLVRISLAFESGSEYIRNKVMRKGLSDEKIYEVAGGCAKYNHLFIQAFFIIGMPEETQETLGETYEMIKKLPLDKIGIFFATPYPGTELFDYCIKHNLLHYRVEEYVDNEYLQHLSDDPHFKPHKLTIEDLVSFREKCYDYLKEKRMTSHIADNYPLRYKG